jgi:hypothetical protein
MIRSYGPYQDFSPNNTMFLISSKTGNLGLNFCYVSIKIKNFNIDFFFSNLDDVSNLS